MIDQMDRDFRLVKTVPFLQAAAGGREGIVRIKRQQNQFVKGAAFQRSDRLSRVRMPVTHGHNRASRNVGQERRFDRPRLLFGKPANRRAAANRGVILRGRILSA